MAYLIKEEGDGYVKAILSILISDTADFLNVGKSMNASQIMQTIEMILEDYSIYKIDFFIACFNKAKRGYYGKQYDRLDGQIIFEWLSQYEYEYQSEIEQGRNTEKTLLEKGLISLSSDQKLISDRDNTPVPMPDNVRELMNKIGKKETMPTKEIKRTPDQILIDGFIKDFNEIHKTNDDFKGGGRYVHFYGTPGKSYDIKEYIEFRVLTHLDSKI